MGLRIAKLILDGQKCGQNWCVSVLKKKKNFFSFHANYLPVKAIFKYISELLFDFSNWGVYAKHERFRKLRGAATRNSFLRH